VDVTLPTLPREILSVPALSVSKQPARLNDSSPSVVRQPFSGGFPDGSPLPVVPAPPVTQLPLESLADSATAVGNELINLALGGPSVNPLVLLCYKLLEGQGINFASGIVRVG
jgi:hypothetical protein